jgi:hypothetical protein
VIIPVAEIMGGSRYQPRTWRCAMWSRPQLGKATRGPSSQRHVELCASNSVPKRIETFDRVALDPHAGLRLCVPRYPHRYSPSPGCWFRCLTLPRRRRGRAFAPLPCRSCCDSQQEVEAGASPLPLRLNPGRGSAVKVVLTTAMIGFGFAYLALCAYGISRTGSTAGVTSATPPPWPSSSAPWPR